MIFTSYFANLRNIVAANIVPVSIARYQPKWYDGNVCLQLAPSQSLLFDIKHGIITQDDYIYTFNQYLATLDALQAYNALVALAPDVALVCYERPGDFCHRHLVAKWLMDNIQNLTILER